MTRAAFADGRPVGAFVFDLDGTLVDSGLDIALAANVALGAVGRPELPVPTVVGYVGDGVAKLLERALGHGGRTFTDDEHAAALGSFRAHYRRHLLDHTRPYDGVPETLRGLADTPLAVATNKPREFADAILAGTGLADLFACVVGGDDAPACKPDPAHVRAALAGCDAGPGDAVVVGDSPNDILAARACGAVAVGCTFGLVAPARVRAAAPDHVIDAFGDLPQLFPPRRT